VSPGRLPLALLGVLLAAPAPATDGEELEALRRAIGEHRERVAGYEREARSLLETLEEMDRASEAILRDLDRAAGEAEAARLRAAELATERQGLEARQAETQAALSARAVALYQAGEPGPLRILFAAESLPDVIRRLDALRLLLSHDRELVARYRGQTRELEAARSEAEEVAKRRDAAAARLDTRTAELRRERRARRVIVERLQKDRKRARAALYELESAAKTLEVTLERLGDARPSGAVPVEGAFASLRGRLEPPVEGSVARGFGRVVDREHRTETFRKGIDYEAERGAAVHAVAPGVVRFVGWFRGYGKIVILDHGGDYFTVSGHLGEIDVEMGQAVVARQRLGAVGDTGSLQGTRLYFEVRRGGQPLDPDEWLSR
jgi:septal ring factor EnvC (AmiA/AmiB activator)